MYVVYHVCVCVGGGGGGVKAKGMLIFHYKMPHSPAPASFNAYETTPHTHARTHTHTTSDPPWAELGYHTCAQPRLDLHIKGQNFYPLNHGGPFTIMKIKKNRAPLKLNI